MIRTMMMRYGLMSFFLTTIGLCGQDIQLKAVHHAKIPLAICVIKGASQEVKQLVSIIKRDCAFSEQFEPALMSLSDFNSEKIMRDLSAHGYCLGLYIGPLSDTSIEWRLCDTASKKIVHKGVYQKKGESLRGWAHAIADDVWPVLTGEPGMFSSRIAYCKEVKIPGKKKVQFICVADYDGSGEQTVVATPTVNLAPRFNRDMHNPLLFYSESTNRNIRLMYIDLQKQRRMASDLDGINMVPSFSSDGTKSVYCASHGVGNCNIFYSQDGAFKQLTNNKSNNVSPVLSDDGKTLFYCSDRQAGVPQVYSYSFNTGVHTPLTFGSGPAYCPTHCAHKNKLAYCKKANGVMQIFVYDETLKKHTQLTFNKGHKDECVWSPCGNYILYCTEQGDSIRIACFNLLTQQERFITPSGTACSYPTWSRTYNQYPHFI